MFTVHLWSILIVLCTSEFCLGYILGSVFYISRSNACLTSNFFQTILQCPRWVSWEEVFQKGSPRWISALLCRQKNGSVGIKICPPLPLKELLSAHTNEIDPIDSCFETVRIAEFQWEHNCLDYDVLQVDYSSSFGQPNAYVLSQNQTINLS